MREQWLNLNGQWEFEFDPKNVGEKLRWFERSGRRFSQAIVVPFPWQAKLSGIAAVDYHGVAWYAKEVVVPKKWNGKHVWLCFGAVDWYAKVWVNGKLVGDHVGGYTPFAFDITSLAPPGQAARIVVRAEDYTSREQPVGKQVGWYTPTGGIWQTVYLEARGEAYVDSLRIIPKLLDGERAAKLSFEVDLRGAAANCDVLVDLAGQTIRLARVLKTLSWRGEATIANPQLWSPEHPHLYDVVVRVLREGRELDCVRSYAGIREVSVARAPGREYTYIYLNGKPIYLRGALHQSFHPDGIYQYPDDATMRHDYEYAKSIGLNFLRIHIKSEIPRALYWADRLGVLIMQDQPNFLNFTSRAQKNWELTLRETIRRDFNHPSIIAWCNFNETWGIGAGGYTPDRQQWVKKMYLLTKQLDPTRLVEDNSANKRDHVCTDINSWHFYINDYQRAREAIAQVVQNTYPGSQFNYAKGYKQTNAPLINSEYGGISAGKGDQDISWCFKFLTNELRKHDKICGYVYTELTDIEWEHNGFLNYDRTEKEFGYDYWFPGFTLADLNCPDFVVLDSPPCPTVAPGAELEVPVFVSHWSDYRARELRLYWALDYLDRFGTMHRDVVSGSRDISWEQYAVTPLGTINVRVPNDAPAAGVLRVWVGDVSSPKLAANYINFHIDSSLPRIEVIDEQTIALRFNPNQVSAWSWKAPDVPSLTSMPEDKVFAYGEGHLAYEINLPERIPADALRRVEFLAELSAKAKDERLAWPARKKPFDYPQTDKGRKWPTDIRITLAGAQVLQTTLKDDPADARGVLSHKFRFHPGSYGWLVRAVLDARRGDKALRRIASTGKLEVHIEVPHDAAHRGGLAVFGDRLGRYPLDPTVILHFSRPHGIAAGFRANEPVVARALIVKREVLLPTAERGAAQWRYTTTRPPANWTAADYDDSPWKIGRGGFGKRGTPNAIINTDWHGADIWLRRTFDVSQPSRVSELLVRLYHDEDAEIYVNGKLALKLTGYVTQYVEHPLSKEVLRLLKPRGNVIAVHCRQTRGGQNIDVGLIALRK